MDRLISNRVKFRKIYLTYSLTAYILGGQGPVGIGDKSLQKEKQTSPTLKFIQIDKLALIPIDEATSVAERTYPSKLFGNEALAFKKENIA